MYLIYVLNLQFSSTNKFRSQLRYIFIIAILPIVDTNYSHKHTYIYNMFYDHKIVFKKYIINYIYIYIKY